MNPTGNPFDAMSEALLIVKQADETTKFIRANTEISKVLAVVQAICEGIDSQRPVDNSTVILALAMVFQESLRTVPDVAFQIFCEAFKQIAAELRACEETALQSDPEDLFEMIFGAMAKAGIELV